MLICQLLIQKTKLNLYSVNNQTKQHLMKKIYLLLVLLTGFANAQIVDIPDASFKYMLLISNTTNTIAYSNGLSHKIDANDDGEIQVSEAIVIDSLDVNQNNGLNNIASISGINEFVNLKKLDCGLNSITTLDFLNLPNLKKLNCSQNNLTSINFFSLPNLEEFYCNNNQLTSINTSNLPLLNLLECYINYITSFNLTLNTSLTSLNCGNNNLTVLNVSNLIDLRQLTCNNNSIQSLDISNNDNLTSLICFSNAINSLVLSQSNNLFLLDCTGNALTSLDFTGLTGLWVLKCGNNPLTTLDVSMLTSLLIFECNNSQLTTLDFSQNHNLTTLSCYANQLQTLFIKNGRDEEFNPANWIENPLLTYICADESQFLDLQSAIDLGIMVNSYCSFTLGGDYNTITGNITFDSNNNGCDANDPDFPNIRINLTQWSDLGSTFTNQSGNYSFYTSASDHLLEPAIENPSFFNISPPNAMISFVDINETFVQDFCISPNGVHDDVEVVILPDVVARPGFDAVYKVVYRNKGNTTVGMPSGLNLYYDATKMDYISSTQTLAAQNTGFLAWDVLNLRPFESRSILVTFNINAPTDQNPVNNGDNLAFSSIISVSNNDENSTDNTFNFNQTVVGSLDPNDITCLQGNMVSPAEIGKYLHYNIRFENTGTAAAEFVVVKVDINTTDFDVNTLQVMNASHPVYTRMKGNKVEFVFQNIQLQSGGHGNVLLKIKSKSNLQQGDEVNKKADIFFDYNFPIATNDEQTVFQALSSPDLEQDNSIKIYPNPTNSIINMTSNFNIKSVVLFDVQGRLLQTNIVNDMSSIIDISEKSKGVYFLKVTTDKGIKVEKLIKE